jgi:NAD(P)H-dependent FMN reductase
MKILVFGASLRAGSYNRKLARNAAELLGQAFPADAVEWVSFRDFAMPVYDGDLEDASGMPEGGQALVAKLAAADAVVISTPEYNGGIPGALKNAIDWVSRADDNPFDGKPLLLLAASPGALGGVRSLWHTRVPLEAMGTVVYPSMFGLPKAGDAFAADDRLLDTKTRDRLGKLLAEFREFAARLSGKA